jgi:L-threonylcarbamoyladenylate synthase
MILEPTAENIDRAAAALREGACVAIPTETVYGLAARIDRDDAIRDVFRRKGRPADNPLIVHVATAADAGGLVRADRQEAVLTIAGAFWPGPLTIVAEKAEGVSDLVTAGQSTVAVRMPDHPVALAVIRAAGAPLAAPSANTSGRPSPTTAMHVEHDLGEDVLILDGGPCAVGIESTVVRVTDGGLLLLRPGGIDADVLQRVTGRTVLRTAAEHELAASPGTRYRHYAPRTNVMLATTHADVLRLIGEVGGNALLLVRPEAAAHFADLRTAPLTEHDLYAELRRADDLHVDRIVVLCDDDVRLREGLFNRVLRAAESVNDHNEGP